MRYSFFLDPFRTDRLTGRGAIVLLVVANSIAMSCSLVATRWTHYSTPFIVITAAVIICAWIASFRQAAITAILGAFFANYFLMHPRPGWALGWADLARCCVWLAFALGLSFLLDRLRRSHDQARKVLSSISEGFVVLDHDWMFIYINDAGSLLLGKKKQEILGRSFWEFVPEAKGTVVEQHLRRAADDKLTVQFEMRFGPHPSWFQIRACPFADGLSIFLEDITAAKEREETLRGVLDRLLRAHRAAQMGAFEWNLSTNELVWSEDMYRLHGLTRQQFDGKFESWVKTIHEEDLPSVLAKIQKCVEDKSEFHTEYRSFTAQGEVRWFGGHGRVLLDENGAAAGIAGLCSDITQRKVEEDALRRTEKLATAGRLAATIAHEINNPLEAVTNLVYLLRRDRDTKTESRDMLRLAEEQLARVNHIAKQTLGFYRDRNVPEAVDVVQTLDELLAILHSRIASKQISIVREYENACLLDGYRGELRQVFSNLLTNAIDASPSGGKLIVRVKPQRVADDIATVHIEIEDFGSGIQLADQQRIFEPFFTTKSDIGTGLGLWVTKELVEKHGGRIGFQSNCQNGNCGTCFFVILPGPDSSKRLTNRAAPLTNPAPDAR